MDNLVTPVWENDHLTDLLAGEETAEQRMADQQDKREAARMERYFEDLREVLRMPSGAGIRVLWHFREQALAQDRIFIPNAKIYANAALHDYMKDRETEMALADPRSYYQLMLESARQGVR